MDNLEPQQPESPSSSPNLSEAAQLKEAFESLRKIVIISLVLTILVSAAFNLFLRWQTKHLGAELQQVRPQILQVVNDYNTNSAPAIKRFLDSLVEFGRTNSDFQPVLKKYGILKAPGPVSPTGAPPATAKSPAPPPKK